MNSPIATAQGNPPASPEPERLGWVDGLRGLSAVYVAITHVFCHLPLFGKSQAITLAHAWFSRGHYSVGLFIVLSGFCLGAPVARRNGELGGVKAFFIRRARRILPPYYACLFVTLLLIQCAGLSEPTGSLWQMSQPATPLHIVTHLFLLQDFYGPFKVNYVLWSIALEVHLYLIFPLLLTVWRRLGIGALLALTPLFALARWSHLSDHIPQPIFWQYGALFACGLAAALIAYGPPNLFRHVVLCGGPAFWIVGTAASLAMMWWNPLDPFYADLIFGFASSMAIVRFAICPETLILIPLGSRIGTFFGSFSYSLYLIHAPLIQLIYLQIVRPMTLNLATATWMLAAIAPPIILPAAYAFYLAFERPSLRRKSRDDAARARRAHAVEST